MAKNLVIVESPSKATTIKKFLGSSYEVIASNGHVRDLPKSQLGIDVDHDFEPKYITIRGKGELLAKLRKEVKKAKPMSVAKHKCAICGRTSDEYPDLEFRFCSKCNGNYEYCQDHLFTHQHVK